MSRNEQKLDDVARAALRIKQRSPDDWRLIIGYIRKQAYPIRIDAEQEEQVKAEYHRKSTASQFLRKFNELEGDE